VDCNSETGSAPAEHKIVTVPIRWVWRALPYPKVDTNITITGH
jgi:hypothetical protein